MAAVLLQTAAGIALWLFVLAGDRHSTAAVAVAALHGVGGALTLGAAVQLRIRVEAVSRRTNIP
jgi:hypothetical protein